MGFRSIVIESLLVAVVASVASAQTYRRAVVDSLGQLRLTTESGRTIVPPKDSDQVAFGQVKLSSDRNRVGWVALYPNCCTSYPIPLKLVVRIAGQDRTFEGNGLPIWQWAFVEGAKQVGFRQAPVHGAGPAHYELRDLATGRLVRTFEPASDTGTGAPPDAPRWVQAVWSQR